MIVYYSLIILPFLFALIELRGSQHVIKQWWLIFVLFVIIIGGTNGNGIDWDGYFVQYSDYRNLSLEELIQFEPGFALLLIVLGDCHVFLFFMAILCFLMVFSTLKHECRYPVVGLFIYIITMSLYMYMGVYRHAIAQSIVIYAWQYRYCNKKFILLLVLACMFHYSSVIALFYFFIPRKTRLPIKTLLLLLILGYLLRSYLVTALSLSSGFFPAIIAGKLGIYMNSEEFGTSFSILFFLFKLFTFVVCYKKISRNDENSAFFINAYAISIILYLVISFTPSFGRLVYYYSCTEIILIPILLSNFAYDYNTSKLKSLRKNCDISVLVFMLFTFVYSYMYTQSLLSYYDIFVPYKSIIF